LVLPWAKAEAPASKELTSKTAGNTRFNNMFTFIAWFQRFSAAWQEPCFIGQENLLSPYSGA
jgi:hypothetical protein